MCMGVIFSFSGWKTVGRVFIWTGFSVLAISLAILFLLVLLEDARRKTPIPHMLQMGKTHEARLTNIVYANGNPIDMLAKTYGEEFAEFSTSMDAGWFVPTLQKIETAGIPGHWSAVGNYLAGEFEKLRDGACKAWTLDADETTFYIVLEREDFDTLSIWICSADKVVMEKLNAAADAQIEICETESMGGNE